MPVIPATDNTDQYISKAGIYLLQPVRIAVWKDQNGIEKKDKTGNPGLYITFKNENGEMLSTGFYYSALPMGDPRRQDESYKCKSEYQLANLKAAMGFTQNETVQPKDFMSKKVWAPIKEIQMYTPEGEYVKSSFDIVKKFFPYIPSIASKGKPSIMGDPATTADGKPSGDFIEVKSDYTGGKVAPKEEKRPRPTVTEQESQPDDSSEETLPSSARPIDEPPDY